ncbi:MAG: putative porin [Propionivibrio sp.]|uniref:putative porin n=1 Tax=Propionivibrio sp. TaxID=2212460 RepID=UPI001A40FF94|nr:putative porin [Propionivibrio sp.]MBL8415617.1 putative porin [Propionivibrio sp.]
MKSNSKHACRVIVGLLFTSLVIGQPVRADDRESLEALRETTLNLIDALVEQKVFSREQAEAMVKAAQVKAAKTVAAEKPKAGAPVRVQYVPETVKNEIRDQLKQEVLAQAKAERWAEPNAVPSWLDRIMWEGDLRLRYQMNQFDPNNAPPIDYIFAADSGTTRAANFLTGTLQTGPTANTTNDQDLYRLRARLGMLARISDDWSAGVRLTTGNDTDRVSTNQTLGTNFNKYTLYVDRAYIRYQPADWLTIIGGRIPNPFFSTDLVWDEDLNFDGIAATFKPAIGDGSIKPFLTIGAFPITADNPPNSSTRWLSAVQAGAKWDMTHKSSLTVGAALYDYNNMGGQPDGDPGIDLVPGFGQYGYGNSLRQKGNTLFLTDFDRTDGEAPQYWGLASKFRPLNLTAMVDLAHFDPVHVILTADYVKNTAYSRSEIKRRTGIALTDGKDYGYLYKVAVGMPKLEKRHDWQATFSYRFLGSDATIDGFTDSDFGLGGTNMKGYTLGLSYAVDQNAWLNLRWLSAESIDSFSLVPSQRYAVDVLQADVNVRF